MNLRSGAFPAESDMVSIIGFSEQGTDLAGARQLTPADLVALTKRLIEHADGIENMASQTMADDMQLAARVIEHLMSGPADLAVDVTGEDGTTRSNVPLREVIGNDQVEYVDCRATLLADGKCTTGGGALPLFHLTLVGNVYLARYSTAGGEQ